jgi:vitamin B12 transporter
LGSFAGLSAPKLIAVATSLLLVPYAAPGLGAESPTELDAVIVTATRTAQTVDETLASVTVVDRAEIERRQARSIDDALRGVPGVAIANTGGRGQPTTLFLRGTDSDHVLVLVDGVKVGSATLGIAPFQDIPIDQVERIEVVRGPRSSLYGSEAIGGVIQIFTRRGGGPLRPRFSVGAGSERSANASLGLSGGGEQGWFDLSGRFEATEGFDACRGEPLVGGCFTFEPDKDGYRNLAGNARAGYRFGDLGEVDLRFLRSESDTDFDGTLFSGNESRTVQQVAGASASLYPLPYWKLGLNAGRSWDELDVFYQGELLDQFDTRRDNLSWQNDLSIGEGQTLTLGIDYQRDQVDSSLDYERTSRSNTGVFGQYLGELQGHRVQLSVRHDDNQQFGGETTGSLAWGYTLDTGLRLTASYGTAFKAPTFNDLYFPFFGNPDLDPETSWSGELGISGETWGTRWSVNLYQTEIDDLIAFDANVLRPENIDSARIRGLEAVAATEVAGWQLNANLTLLDPENRSSGPNQGNRLPRRPEQSLRLDIDRGFGAIRAGASLSGYGRAYDDLANRDRLEGYALIDLRAEYAFSRSLRIQGRIDNLLDEDYETAAFYNQPGRRFFVTLRYEP